MKVISLLYILLMSSMSFADQLSDGSFCQSNDDCYSGCCYDLTCDQFQSTCKIMNLLANEYDDPSCTIDSDCSSDGSGCCINRQCFNSDQCFKVFSMPTIMGVLFSVPIFGMIAMGACIRFNLVQGKKQKLNEEEERQKRALEESELNKVNVNEGVSLDEPHDHDQDHKEEEGIHNTQEKMKKKKKVKKVMTNRVDEEKKDKSNKSDGLIDAYLDNTHTPKISKQHNLEVLTFTQSNVGYAQSVSSRSAVARKNEKVETENDFDNILMRNTYQQQQDSSYQDGDVSQVKKKKKLKKKKAAQGLDDNSKPSKTASGFNPNGDYSGNRMFTRKKIKNSTFSQAKDYNERRLDVQAKKNQLDLLQAEEGFADNDADAHIPHANNYF